MPPLVRALLLATPLICWGCASTSRPIGPSLQSYRLPERITPLPAAPGGLGLFTSSGNIHVAAGEPSQIAKQLTICAGSEEQAREWASQCHVVPTRDDNGRVLIDLTRHVGVPFESVGADLRLTLPEQLALDLRSSSGLIDTASYSARKLELATRSGALRVGLVADALRFRTDSGQVHLLARFALAEGRTETGSVEVRAPARGARLDFETRSGLCTLRIPKGMPVRVVFRTLTGKFAPELPVQRERLEEAGEGSSGYNAWRILVNADMIRSGSALFEAEITSEDGALRLVPDAAGPAESARSTDRGAARDAGHAAHPPGSATSGRPAPGRSARR